MALMRCQANSFHKSKPEILGRNGSFALPIYERNFADTTGNGRDNFTKPSHSGWLISLLFVGPAEQLLHENSSCFSPLSSRTLRWHCPGQPQSDGARSARSPAWRRCQ